MRADGQEDPRVEPEDNGGVQLEMCVELCIPAFAGNADLKVRFRDDEV